MDDNYMENIPTYEDEIPQPTESYYEPPYSPENVSKPKNTVDVVLEKIKSLPKYVWGIVAGGVVALIALVVVLSLLGNSYKTPIQKAEKLLNAKSLSKIVDKAPSILNGFCETEAKNILKIIKKSDDYADAMEDAEDEFADIIESVQDECGKNYKIALNVEEKEELERADVRAFRDELRDIAEYAEDLDEMDSDDYEDMADEMGITKSQAKDLVKQLEKACKKCKTASVTAGYKLSVVVSVSGSEMDEPEETELTVNVFKVDGRWVPDVFSLMDEINIYSLLYALS